MKFFNNIILITGYLTVFLKIIAEPNRPGGHYVVQKELMEKYAGLVFKTHKGPSPL